MQSQGLAFVILFVVVAACFGAWAVWRQARIERQRWTRYNRPRGSGPKSWVCPSCLTRHYGERAIREQKCRACEAPSET